MQAEGKRMRLRADRVFKRPMLTPPLSAESIRELYRKHTAKQMAAWIYARDGREDEDPPSNPKKEKVFKEMYPVLCACMERKGFCLKSKNITAKAKALLALTKSINKRNKTSRKKNLKLGVTNIARYPDDSFCPSGRYPTRPTLCSLNGGTVTKVAQVSVVDMVWFCSLIN